MTSAETRLAWEKLRRWRAHPDQFVREDLGAEPDEWQLEALRLIVISPRLAMKACKGPGKTATLAWIILWFLVCYEDAIVGCTSITQDNLEMNLWTELSRWLQRSKFTQTVFRWTKTKVEHKQHPSTWYAVARAWPRQGDAEQQALALAGLHAPHVMFVLDESGGIPQAVMTTAEAVLSNCVVGHVVQSGNPTHTAGPLHAACTTQRHLWAVVTITGDPDDPNRSPRISKQWAQEQIDLYGRENPWVKVNVLGEFPPASINALLGVEDVEAAMKRHYKRDAFEWAQRRLGVDAARFGDDPWVIFPRQGLAAFRPVVMRNPRTTDVSARIARAHRDWHPEMILIDDTGHWGHGVVDLCTTAGLPIIPIVYSDPGLNKRYKNRRAEMYLEMADWVKKGGALPYDIELLQELTVHTYCFLGGKFVLEDKDQVKAKLGRSPNKSDALAQTFAMPEMPGELYEKLRGRNTVLHDGDPFADPTFQRETGQALHDFDPYAGI